MKEEFIKDIMSIFKHDDVKEEFNTISKMVTDYILQKLNPYMYFIITIIGIILLSNIINTCLFLYLFRRIRKMKNY
mgnify:CR=1 FL=1